MVKNVEGIASVHVPDSTKICCPRCNSTLLYISSTLDDPNDIIKDAIFAAYDITITGGSIQGLVALCHNCGNEFVPLWYLFDEGAITGAAVTMSNLDAGTANLLADLYMIPLEGTDFGALKYHVIASHTAATPTVITLDTASGDDSEDGAWMLTNILPVGLTLAS